MEPYKPQANNLIKVIKPGQPTWSSQKAYYQVTLVEDNGDHYLLALDWVQGMWIPDKKLHNLKLTVPKTVCESYLVFKNFLDTFFV